MNQQIQKVDLNALAAELASARDIIDLYVSVHTGDHCNALHSAMEIVDKVNERLSGEACSSSGSRSPTR